MKKSLPSAERHPIPWHEMGGLAIVGVAVYVAWAYLYPFDSGAWGQSIGLTLWNGMGEGGLFLCALIALWGVRIGFPQAVRRFALLPWTLVALVELLVLEVVSWLVADAGGEVGRSLGQATAGGLGRLGAWLVWGGAGLFTVMGWLRWSPSRHVAKVAEHVPTLLSKLRERMPARRVRGSAEDGTGDETPPSVLPKLFAKKAGTGPTNSAGAADAAGDRDGRGPSALDAATDAGPRATPPTGAPEGASDVDDPPADENPAGVRTSRPPTDAGKQASEDDAPPWDEPAAPTHKPQPPAKVPSTEGRSPATTPRPVAVAEPGWDLRTALETDYRLPPLELLSRSQPQTQQPQRDHSHMLMETLQSFGVTAAVTNAVRGPTVTRYELSPARGVKVSSITALSNDIALALAAQAIRLEAPIPGKSAIGIEVPNERPEVVGLRELLESPEYRKATGLPLALGRDISGRAVVTDLLKAPHLLIAGSTGSGKSVCLNTIIASILFRATPLEVQMVMVDIKRVELSIFEGIPHLAATSPNPQQRIVTDAKTGTLALKTITDIMMQRYDLFTQVRVRNIGEYNRKAETPLPFLVVIIDELAELMQVSARAVEGYIQRIAQMGRAAGLHLILATQRPSVDVITGTIKANFPARIAFAVKSQVDSRTILDRAGADKLLGRGDMLFSPTGSDTFRVQGAYVDISEMERVIDFWKGQAAPENLTGLTMDSTPMEEAASAPAADDDDEMDDDLIQEALKVIRLTKLASASNLQRRMKLGYPKAGRLMDVLEKRGYVGPADGSKPRKILFLEGED